MDSVINSSIIIHYSWHCTSVMKGFTIIASTVQSDVDSTWIAFSAKRRYLKNFQCRINEH